jgi:hypothetical protein
METALLIWIIGFGISLGHCEGRGGVGILDGLSLIVSWPLYLGYELAVKDK